MKVVERKRRLRLLRWAAPLTLVSLALVGCGVREPRTEGATPGARRLTETQYRNVIADVFGSDIKVIGRFDPLPRLHGLTEVGARDAAITASGLERLEDIARSIAGQVVDGDHRSFFVACVPRAGAPFDKACAQAFYRHLGRLLYRRPLSEDEIRLLAGTAETAAANLGDFYSGLAAGLSGMLISPDFLYIADRVEPDPSNSKVRRLDSYAKASRLSFFLWNTAPDDMLLTAAERGELQSARGLTRQVDRMLQSPRLKVGVRAFFSDMLDLDAFDTLAKDPIIYPSFTLAVANDAREQILRTLVHLVVDERGDYRDVFTTRDTFVSGTLGMIYGVPAAVRGGWVPYTYDKDDPHAGITAELGFVALHSHPGRSSPTLRGKAVRELLLCQTVPAPPADVNFDLFNDPNSPSKTQRQRLAAHATNPTCAGCHKIMDPIGLTLENFDGAGQFRTLENEVTINADGELDGQKFSGPLGLGRALHDSRAIPTCLVNRLYAYAAGRELGAKDKAWVGFLEKRFADDGYRIPELMRLIATSHAYYQFSDHPELSRTAAAANIRPGKSAP